MRGFAFLLLTAVAGIGLTATTPKAQAQVAVDVGVAPDCPYGYYDVPPYDCAPAGYYGPEWFSGGIFIGAGPWFHGASNFHGYVDNHSIRTTAIRVHCQNAARKPSPQSAWMRRILKATRCATDAAT
jgi:hypothetical protein